LLEFPGCAVVVSHDRWFLDRVATHILAWEGTDEDPAKWYWFEGNFEAYEQNKVERLGEDAARPHRATHRRLTRGGASRTDASVRSGGSPPQTHRRSGSAEPRSGTQPFAETPQRVEQHPHEDRAGDADDDGQDGDETHVQIGVRPQKQQSEDREDDEQRHIDQSTQNGGDDVHHRGVVLQRVSLTRTMPSCATVASSVPSAAKMRP